MYCITISTETQPELPIYADTGHTMNVIIWPLVMQWRKNAKRTGDETINVYNERNGLGFSVPLATAKRDAFHYEVCRLLGYYRD